MCKFTSLSWTASTPVSVYTFHLIMNYHNHRNFHRYLPSELVNCCQIMLCFCQSKSKCPRCGRSEDTQCNRTAALHEAYASEVNPVIFNSMTITSTYHTVCPVCVLCVSCVHGIQMSLHFHCYSMLILCSLGVNNIGDEGVTHLCQFGFKRIPNLTHLQ